MEKIAKIKSLQSTNIDSSFEEEISELNSELEKEKETETPKKYLEDFNLNEIYNFVDEIDKINTKDMNSIFKKEKIVLLLPNKDDNNECKEILDIYNKRSPFKSLKEPIKVSLIGKVFIYDFNDIIDIKSKDSNLSTS